jgi:hypothetical protein
MGDLQQIYTSSDCGCNERTGTMCFKHKLRTIQFDSRARSPQSQMESRWEKDMPAYQRLRWNGLQPPKIDGCAQLEQRANSQMEIEMGHLIAPEILPQVAEGMAISKEMGWAPQDSVEAMKDKYHRDPA